MKPPALYGFIAREMCYYIYLQVKDTSIVKSPVLSYKSFPYSSNKPVDKTRVKAEKKRKDKSNC